jgi:hypothetical protein
MASNSRRGRTEWLIGQLARLPVPPIIEFELHLTAQRKRVDTRLMWGAAWNIDPDQRHVKLPRLTALLR